MKKLYSFICAFAATALCASAAVQPVSSGRLIKLNENVMRKSAAVSPDAYVMQAAAAASDAPASLENNQFVMTFDMPDYDENGNYLGSDAVSTMFTLTDPLPLSDGSISYYMTDFLDGFFNPEVSVLQLEAIYNPASGELSIDAGQDFLQVGSNVYKTWTLGEGTAVYGALPVVFAWENGAFKFVPTYNTSSGTVTTTGFSAGIQTTQGVSIAFELVNPNIIKTNGSMSTKVYGWNKQTNAQSIFMNEDGLLAEVADGKLSLYNFFGIGFDQAVEFAINSADKKLTANSSKTVTIGQYQSTLAPAINDLGSATEKGNATKGQGDLVATYSVSGGKTTISVPDFNFFVRTAALYYPLTECSVVLDFSIDDANAGISDVIADNDANAPVEYFNLQGMRINEPAAGQLVIRRQGKTVSKLIVK